MNELIQSAGLHSLGYSGFLGLAELWSVLAELCQSFAGLSLKLAGLYKISAELYSILAELFFIQEGFLYLIIEMSI